jgi:hypothetical protein
MRWLAPFPDATGRRMHMQNQGLGPENAMMIPRATRQLDNVMRFMNVIADPVVYNYVYNGTEGVEYTVVAPGVWDVNLDVYMQTRFTAWWWRLTSSHTILEKSFVIGAFGQGAENAHSYILMNEATLAYQVPNPIGGMPPSAIAGRHAMALNAIVDDFLIQVITGTQDVETMYNRMLGVWQAEGGTETMTDLNRIFTEWRR